MDGPAAGGEVGEGFVDVEWFLASVCGSHRRIVFDGVGWCAGGPAVNVLGDAPAPLDFTQTQRDADVDLEEVDAGVDGLW